MKPINRFELIGMFLSISAMALALAFLRFETPFSFSTNTTTSITQPASVVVVDEANSNETAALANAVVEAAPSATLRSLIVDDVLIGGGKEVKAGDEIEVHYIGRLQNGQEFDNSYIKGTPFRFTVGQGDVIAGWDEGVIGMKEGGQRILIIPAHLAYGENGAGPIPGEATLIFAIELLAINE